MAGAALAAVLVGALPIARDALTDGPDDRVQAALRVEHLTAAPGDLSVVRPGYRLVVDPLTGLMAVGSPSGVVYTRLPLVALVGRSALPRGSRCQVTAADGALLAQTVDPTGAVISSASVALSDSSFVVRFSAPNGPDATLTPRFFFDGRRGLDLGLVDGGFTPDAGPASRAALPAVNTAVRTPLAPAPFDVALHSAAGWMGLGLVEVPDATTMALDSHGAVNIDYPLPLLGEGSSTDEQRGTPRTFPAFVVTFGASALASLRAYHDALVALGTVPATPATGPAWWYAPMVDTWGEQVAEGRARRSPAYTAAWVRSFVAGVERHYGLRHFTVVIDSAWQRVIGEPEPDPTRFGGWNGMRQLVDQLHAQGLRVMLWWPLWGHAVAHVPPARSELRSGARGTYIDPTDPTFAPSMAAAAQRLVGTGPGDLAADGLKLDWAYDIPTHLRNPLAGWGAAALYHYLDVLHRTVHATRADALVEASAAAPQFQTVTDAVRLYDAWKEADWGTRAAVVAAADPGELIDGDGWATGPRTAVVHAVSSTVYGDPALYYDSRWATGAPIPAATMRLIGEVMSLALVRRGPGSASPLGDGWLWTGQDVVLRSLAGDADLFAWHAASCGGSGTLVATEPGTVLVPLATSGRVTVRRAGARVPVTSVRGSLRLTVSPGAPYLLSASC